MVAVLQKPCPEVGPVSRPGASPDSAEVAKAGRLHLLPESRRSRSGGRSRFPAPLEFGESGGRERLPNASGALKPLGTRQARGGVPSVAGVPPASAAGTPPAPVRALRGASPSPLQACRPRPACVEKPRIRRPRTCGDDVPGGERAREQSRPGSGHRSCSPVPGWSDAPSPTFPRPPGRARRFHGVRSPLES